MAEDTEGKRIAQARRRLGVLVERDISQVELARLLAVSGNSVVWNWEEGNSRPSDENRARLSRVLGVTEAYLKYGSEPRDVPGWKPPDTTVLELEEAESENARAAVAKKRPAAKKRRRGA